MAQEAYRFAVEEDVPVILGLVKQLAEYEKAPERVVATEEMLRTSLFEKRYAEVILVEVDERTVGFALFFHSFSTWLGQPGLFLEDLFVLPDARGKGYGKGLLQRLAGIAIERGCGRLEWNCLNWNKPSIDFYLSLGAAPMDEWTTYRIEGPTLNALAAKPSEGLDCTGHGA